MHTITLRGGSPIEVDAFTWGYIVAGFWSTTDNSTPQGGEPLDKNYEYSDLAEVSLQQIIVDCKLFQEKYGHLITEENETTSRRQCTVEEYAGHDFWLTQHHHGCGFWDGDWIKSVGAVLTEGSKAFKERELVVGDDGRIYLE